MPRSQETPQPPHPETCAETLARWQEEQVAVARRLISQRSVKRPGSFYFEADFFFVLAMPVTEVTKGMPQGLALPPHGVTMTPQQLLEANGD